MQYKTTLIKCKYDKKSGEYTLPEMVPPTEEEGWSIVNFQPCAGQNSFDSSYLVVWELDA